LLYEIRGRQATILLRVRASHLTYTKFPMISRKGAWPLYALCSTSQSMKVIACARLTSAIRIFMFQASGIIMEKVTLRNGASEPLALVISTMFALEFLMNGDLDEIHELCDLHAIALGTSDHIDATSIAHLKKLHLLQPDGSLHHSIRNIVLSACEGTGLRMTLSSPLAPGQQNAPTARTPGANSG
jgi:hypothetical protein